MTYDQGLDEHNSLTQKSLKNQGKRPFGSKFSSPAARYKGLRLGDGAASPESATLTVTIIHAWSQGDVDVQGQLRQRSASLRIRERDVVL